MEAIQIQGKDLCWVIVYFTVIPSKLTIAMGEKKSNGTWKCDANNEIFFDIIKSTDYIQQVPK